ncbi:MAG TPA: response regulator [bacterium]|nr:response regulator [bacterium]
MSESGLRVLVVDDEQAIRRFLRVSLTAHGHNVFEAENGEAALAAAAANRPDVIILDLGLPDIDGVAVAKRLREWTRTPIIVLSVRDQEDAKVDALDAGADDYLTKPFGVGELMARIRVAIRHATRPAQEPVFTAGDLVVDLTRRQVTVGGREVTLTPTEYDLLKALITQAGKVVTHRQLLHQVWGAGYEQGAHLLQVNVSNLRRKLEPDPARPRFIQTEPGVGYRLREGA